MVLSPIVASGFQLIIQIGIVFVIKSVSPVLVILVAKAFHAYCLGYFSRFPSVMSFVLIEFVDFPVEVAYGFKPSVSVKGLNGFVIVESPKACLAFANSCLDLVFELSLIWVVCAV